MELDANVSTPDRAPSGFSELIGPIAKSGGQYRLSLEARHTNSHGTAHGGLLTAFADQAIGWSVYEMLSPGESCITLQLSIRYVGVAKLNQTVAIEVEFSKVTKSYFFVNATIHVDGEHIALCEGIWRVVRSRAPMANS